MQSPHDAYSFELVATLNELVTDLRARRVFLLSMAGIDGTYAWHLKSLFRELGALHLLVLSGSQVGSLYKLSNQVFWISGRLFGAGVVWRLTTSLLGLALIVLFCIWSGQSPPLVRATLWIVSMFLMPSIGFVDRTLLVLGIQVVVLGTPLTNLSLILSWAAFLGMCFFSQLLTSKVASVLATTVFAQLICCVLFDQNVFDQAWPRTLGANLVLIFLFDRLIVPLGSIALLIGGLRFFDMAAPLIAICRPLFEIAGWAVLVALNELR